VTESLNSFGVTFSLNYHIRLAFSLTESSKQPTIFSVQTLSNIAIVLGSIGMIYCAIKVPFTTYLWELKDDQKAYKFLGKVNGYYVWLGSWFLVLLGTVLQLIIPWLSLLAID
jgi:hypothetical protein